MYNQDDNYKKRENISNENEIYENKTVLKGEDIKDYKNPLYKELEKNRKERIKNAKDSKEDYPSDFEYESTSTGEKLREVPFNYGLHSVEENIKESVERKEEVSLREVLSREHQRYTSDEDAVIRNKEDIEKDSATEKRFSTEPLGLGRGYKVEEIPIEVKKATIIPVKKPEDELFRDSDFVESPEEEYIDYEKDNPLLDNEK